MPHSSETVPNLDTVEKTINQELLDDTARQIWGAELKQQPTGIGNPREGNELSNIHFPECSCGSPLILLSPHINIPLQPVEMCRFMCSSCEKEVRYLFEKSLGTFTLICPRIEAMTGVAAKKEEK